MPWSAFLALHFSAFWIIIDRRSVLFCKCLMSNTSNVSLLMMMLMLLLQVVLCLCQSLQHRLWGAGLLWPASTFQLFKRRTTTCLLGAQKTVQTAAETNAHLIDCRHTTSTFFFFFSSHTLVFKFNKLPHNERGLVCVCVCAMSWASPSLREEGRKTVVIC